MIKAFYYSFILLVLIAGKFVSAQVYGTGLLLDDTSFVNCPSAPVLITRDLLNLPDKFSLKQYAPTPGSQGIYSTCCGWALAYAARTIIAAIQNNWDRAEIDSNEFSPSYIYNQIRSREDCNSGTSIIEGLKVLENNGVLTLKEFPYSCEAKIREDQLPDASVNKIKEYRTILFRDIKNKVIIVKKSLSERNPVIAAINSPPSFQTAGEVWEPDRVEYSKTYSGHALVVIGYDDAKAGGAFEVINSWGTDWGNGGFTWIKYSDFEHFCVWAGEEIPEKNIKENEYKLSGSLLFKLINDSVMSAKRSENYFRMSKEYISGTQFRLMLANNEPAYVYALGSDTTSKCNVIFPYDKKINAYLPYKQNNVCLPSENYAYELDKTTGKTYFCFIYSPLKLEIDSVASCIENAEGDFKERVYKAIQGKIIPPQGIKYNEDENGVINFNAVSNGRQLVLLIFEIPHIGKT